MNDNQCFSVILFGITAVVVINYQLDDKMHNRLIVNLDYGNRKPEGEKMIEQEMKELKDLLI